MSTEFLTAARGRGRQFISVVLMCSLEENEKRMASNERVKRVEEGRGGLIDTVLLDEIRNTAETFRFGLPNELVLDVSSLTADEAASTVALLVQDVVQR